VDIRSDLYSLGVSLWQMLTGQVPFQGSAAGVMSQHQWSDIEPVDRIARRAAGLEGHERSGSVNVSLNLVNQRIEVIWREADAKTIDI
jgi:serine/threonine protein kinase